MIFLLLALGALFVSKKVNGGASTQATSISNSPVPPTSAPRAMTATATPVIQNSVGSSLSQALGNANRSPKHYSSGTPGTNGETLPPSSSLKYYLRQRKVQVPAMTPNVSNPALGGNQTNITQHNPPRPVHTRVMVRGRLKTVSSALVNPKQELEPFGPETAGAFWTK